MNILAQLAQQPGNWRFVAIAIGVMSFVFAILIVVGLAFFRPWLRAFLAGHPISLMTLIGMKLRRSPAKKIIDQGIVLAHAGCPVSWQDLERAAIQGANLEKTGLAYITAQERKLSFSFLELVEAERESRLNELLK